MSLSQFIWVLAIGFFFLVVLYLFPKLNVQKPSLSGLSTLCLRSLQLFAQRRSLWLLLFVLLIARHTIDKFLGYWWLTRVRPEFTQFPDLGYRPWTSVLSDIIRYQLPAYDYFPFTGGSFLFVILVFLGRKARHATPRLYYILGTVALLFLLCEVSVWTWGLANPNSLLSQGSSGITTIMKPLMVLQWSGALLLATFWVSVLVACTVEGSIRTAIARSFQLTRGQWLWLLSYVLIASMVSLKVGTEFVLGVSLPTPHWLFLLERWLPFALATFLLVLPFAVVSERSAGSDPLRRTVGLWTTHLYTIVLLLIAVWLTWILLQLVERFVGATYFPARVELGWSHWLLSAGSSIVFEGGRLFLGLVFLFAVAQFFTPAKGERRRKGTKVREVT